MIQDINPLHISRISFERFRRHGMHPLYYRFAKRIGWMYLFWAKLTHDQDYNYVFPAKVIIHGQDSVLQSITCRSNQAALNLHNKLNLELEDFIQSLRKPHETE